MTRNTKTTTISTIYDSTTDDEMNNFFYDEEMNLDKELDNRIIAIVDGGFWYGRRQGYAMGSNNLKDILRLVNGDNCEIDVFYDGVNVRKNVHHHDGTHYVLLRECKPNVNIEKFCDKLYNGEYIDTKTLCRYTTSLKKYVKEIYGF